MTLPPEEAADPFGLWESLDEQASPGGGPTSFGLPVSLGGDQSREGLAGAAWRVDGKAELEARERRVQAVIRGLEEAETRLEAVLEAQTFAYQAGGQAPPGAAGLSYPPGSPEGRLLAALASGQAQEGQSYGLLDHLPGAGEWRRMHSELRRLLDFTGRQLLNFAWVETCDEGLAVARTTIHWGGDMENLWLQQATSEQAGLHRRSLEQAVKSRQAGLRAAASAAGMAARLALAFSTPLGPVQVMALAWRFISEMIDLRAKAGER